MDTNGTEEIVHISEVQPRNEKGVLIKEVSSIQDYP